MIKRMRRLIVSLFDSIIEENKLREEMESWETAAIEDQRG